MNEFITLLREKETSAKGGFHADPLFSSKLEFGSVAFSGGRKTGTPGETLRPVYEPHLYKVSALTPACAILFP